MSGDEARAIAGKGVKVIYRSHPGAQPEEGVVTSVGAGAFPMVFVRYGADVHSKATRASDLEVMGGTVDLLGALQRSVDAARAARHGDES